MKMPKSETPKMFDEIAGSYDSMNHILSFGLDRRWRKKFVKNLSYRKYNVIADIASGTGDLLTELKKLGADKYYAVDPSRKMLAIADSKICDADFINAFAEELPFEDNSIDLVTIAFGIRNFSDLQKAFSEIHRILKENGVLSIMEFSLPNFFLFRWGFLIYIKFFMPLIIKLLSKDENAYAYLKNSIIDFNENVDVFELLKLNDFKNISLKKMAFGAVNIYTCTK